MQDINSVVIIGRLTKDIEVKYLTSGTACGDISVAVNEKKKNKDKWEEYVNFFDVTVWGKTAENLKQYLTKGKQVAITGALQQQRWEKDGKKYSKVVIKAEDIQLIGGNGAKAESSAGCDSDFTEDILF